MKGWKTWTAAGLVILTGIAKGLEMAGVLPHGLGDIIVTIIGSVAGALGLVGVGHKIDRIGGGK